MEKLKLSQIAGAVNAVCTADAEIDRIVTDTSQVVPGSLFVAIKGERFDGHDFIAKAAVEGASAILSEREADVGIPVLVVPSTRQALLDLAGWYRSLFHTFVAGVTGSVGKTIPVRRMSGQLRFRKRRIGRNSISGITAIPFRR